MKPNTSPLRMSSPPIGPPSSDAGKLQYAASFHTPDWFLVNA